MTELRTVKRIVNDQYETIRLIDIKANDRFVMFEPTGDTETPVGGGIWVAIDDAVMHDDVFAGVNAILESEIK
jgi:hypothetical protein